jgi:CRP-like cAMP-binding protein
MDGYANLITELRKIAGRGDWIDEDQVRRNFRVVQYARGQQFVREGDIPDQLGFIVKGLMKYYYIDPDGNEWIKHFSAENEYVASYGSFLYQMPSMYYIEATEDTTLLTIAYQTYMESINQSLVWCLVARKYTEWIYYEKEKREASFLKLNGTQRYQAFLEEYPLLSQRIDQKDTASFLGLNPVSLSRIRRSLRK